MLGEVGSLRSRYVFWRTRWRWRNRGHNRSLLDQRSLSETYLANMVTPNVTGASSAIQQSRSDTPRPLPYDRGSTRTKIAKDNIMKLAQLQQIYELPFFELLTKARAIFVQHWENQSVQLCTLLSIKTGGCSEDCAYCAQSARYHTAVTREALMEPAAVLGIAERARANGSTRFCMGAAWKGVRDGEPKFAQVLEIVRGVSRLGMEVCVTLGQSR